MDTLMCEVGFVGQPPTWRGPLDEFVAGNEGMEGSEVAAIARALTSDCVCGYIGGGGGGASFYVRRPSLATIGG